MEEIDRRIITLLARDGRMSFTDLARETGLSVSAVHQRVRRLEQRGGGRLVQLTVEAKDQADQTMDMLLAKKRAICRCGGVCTP